MREDLPYIRQELKKYLLARWIVQWNIRKTILETKKISPNLYIPAIVETDLFQPSLTMRREGTKMYNTQRQV